MTFSAPPPFLRQCFCLSYIWIGENFSFLSKENRVHRLPSKDLKTSAAVSTYQKDEEAKKSKFPTVFWLKNDISKNEQE